MKSKEPGGRTGLTLFKEMSDDGIGEDNKTDEGERESEATSQRTSPRKGHTESPESLLRRSGRSRK